MKADDRFEFKAKDKRVIFLLILIGILSLVFGFSNEATRTRAWASVLLNNYYFITLSLGAVLFMAIQYAVQAGWSTVLRRVPEAMSTFLPVGALLMLGIYFGIHELYHWAHHGITDPTSPHYDALLAGKAGYLNIKFFLIRMVVFLGIWVLFAKVFRKNSLEEDASGNIQFYRKNFRNSCIFLAFYAITITLASFDWLMSLEPHWFSTIFGVYNFAGMFVNGVVGITLITLFLKGRDYLEKVNEDHLHDLGKLIFAFSIFWAYIWISQLLLIWYSNIPEEVTYYQARWIPHYKGLFFMNLVINFVFPFLVLMRRGSKRDFKTLKLVATILVVGHYLDLYLMIMPGPLGERAVIGLIEVGSFLGYLGLFVLVVFTALSKVKLVPQKVAYLEESLSYHQ
ncbi:MAG: quinol:cytochrome C oxidoreductase [Deltaproteobacteria bacterium]|nr:quinol:cytochrome C oxidoreductase [Deltaproteobacteria bacterium]